MIDEVKTIINDTIKTVETTKELDIRMYVIDKKSYGKTVEKRFKVKKVRITQELNKFFKNILISNLQKLDKSLSDGDKKICNFFDVNADDKDVFLIPLNDVEVFSYILNQINQYTNLEELKDTKEVKNICGYAVEIRPEDGNRIIYLRNFLRKKYLAKKGKIFISVYEGVFNIIRGDIFTIDTYTDCFYVSDYNNIIILHKKDFENMFSFKEYYFKVASETFESREFQKFVEFPNEVYEIINQNSTIAKKITNLVKTSKLDEELIKVFEKSKRELPTLKYEISNGKIIIKDKESLNDFLDIWSENIVRSLGRERLYCVSGGKREIEPA